MDNDLQKLALQLHSAQEKHRACGREVERLRALVEQALGDSALAEGTRTHEIEGVKIKAAYKLNRKLNAERWLEIRDQFPEHLRPVTEETAYKLETRGYRYFEKTRNDAELALLELLETAIETKPAKTSISVEILEGDDV